MFTNARCSRDRPARFRLDLHECGTLDRSGTGLGRYLLHVFNIFESQFQHIRNSNWHKAKDFLGHRVHCQVGKVPEKCFIVSKHLNTLHWFSSFYVLTSWHCAVFA